MKTFMKVEVKDNKNLLINTSSVSGENMLSMFVTDKSRRHANYAEYILPLYLIRKGVYQHHYPWYRYTLGLQSITWCYYYLLLDATNLVPALLYLVLSHPGAALFKNRCGPD